MQRVGAQLQVVHRGQPSLVASCCFKVEGDSGIVLLKLHLTGILGAWAIFKIGIVFRTQKKVGHVVPAFIPFTLLSQKGP